MSSFRIEGFEGNKDAERIKAATRKGETAGSGEPVYIGERTMLFLRLVALHRGISIGEWIARAAVAEANAIGISTLADLEEKQS